MIKNYDCDLTWVRVSGGDLPNGAVEGGVTADHQPLYVARLRIQGAVAMGAFNPLEGTCSVPYGGQEWCRSEFEILTFK